MPNTSNKIGRFNEPINVGDWCIHDNDMPRHLYEKMAFIDDYR